MTARELLAWGDLEARRRRKSGGTSLGPWGLSAAGGAVLCAEIARRLFSGDPGAAVSASRLWLVVCAAAHILVFFGAPFRTFWRFDSALLARLPVEGGPLFRLSVLRALRATAQVALPLLAAVLILGAFGSWEAALRHLAVLGLAALGAGLFAPALTLAAGAAVASDKAQAIAQSFGGELQAPRTTWLGALPGLGATALAVALLAAAPWAAGARPPGGEPLFFFVPGILLPLAAIAWALARAGAVMPAALREVSALDQERLAHVERSTPSRLEHLWFRLFLGKSGALVADKDARLSRRRYPSPYFLFPLGILILWILCAARPADLLLWGGALLACLGAYGALMARRLTAPPIEHPRLLASLPLAPRDVRAAKRIHALLRLCVLFVLAGVPLALRAPEPLTAAGFVLAVGAGSVALAIWSLRRQSPM